MSDPADGPRRTVHGRRRGRPLRKGRAAALETTLPVNEIALPAPGGQLDLGGLFGRQTPQTWLEIGFGGGEHLAALAACHRDVSFIGCEPFINGMASLLVSIERERLDNVRILMDDARLLLAALPDQSLDRVHILFPDPWPKKRHNRRRIVSPAVLDQLARTMKPGAMLRLATDHGDYGAWMLRHLLDRPEFRWTAARADDWRIRPVEEPETRYEAKALAKGLKPIYLTFLRR